MKMAEETSAQAIAERLTATIAPKLSLVQSLVKEHASGALNTLDAAMKTAEEAPPRMVAAAMAGTLAFSIGFVELVIKLFG